MKIVVIVGTGNIGSKLVSQLAQQGHETVAAAPETGVNTLTGEGLTDALAGASVVIYFQAKVTQEQLIEKSSIP